MTNSSCVHYTGKRLCLIGNICEGEMPCYESIDSSAFTPGICFYCGTAFEPSRPNNKFCSKLCKDRLYNKQYRSRLKEEGSNDNQ